MRREEAMQSEKSTNTEAVPDGVAFKPWSLVEWQNWAPARKRLLMMVLLTLAIGYLAIILYLLNLLPWWEGRARDISEFEILVLSYPLMLLAYQGFSSRKRLIVNGTGIHLSAPFGFGWTATWNEIVEIRLTFDDSGGGRGWIYDIRCNSGQRNRIVAAQWAANSREWPEFPRPRHLAWSAKPAEGREYLLRSDLHKQLGNPLADRASRPRVTIEDFIRTREGLAIIAVAVVLVIYAFIDWRNFSEQRLLGGGFPFVFVVGLLACVSLGFFLARKKTGTEKAIAVIIMIIPGFFAPPPLAVRLNAITDWSGPEVMEYRRDGSLLVPVDEGPVIDLSAHRRFRAGYRPADSQELVIRRGLLGFSQLDLKSITWLPGDSSE